MSTELTTQIANVKAFMEDPARKAAMFSALPRHLSADRMIRVALTACRKNPKLLEASQASLFAAITEASTLGLETDGYLGQAYLVPFYNSRERCHEVVLIPGYRGLINLMRRSGEISTIALECVHEGDRFDYQLGDNPYVNHIPNDEDPERDDKPITHVYCIIGLRDGGIQRSVWSQHKVNSHMRRYSKAWAWAESGAKNKGGGKKDSAWHTDWPVMAKKTVVRDMINRGLVPVSIELQRMMVREEYIDAQVEPAAPQGLTVAPPKSLDDLTNRLEGKDEEPEPEPDSEPDKTDDADFEEAAKAEQDKLFETEQEGIGQ